MNWKINIDTAQFSCLSHCPRIRWSWKTKKRRTIRVSSSSVSSCDASRVPFCSFCFSSYGFSLSFSSSSPLRQMRKRTCCVSSSSFWSPHHSMRKQILGVKKANKQTKNKSLKRSQTCNMTNRSKSVQNKLCTDLHRNVCIPTLSMSQILSVKESLTCFKISTHTIQTEHLNIYCICIYISLCFCCEKTIQA